MDGFIKITKVVLATIILAALFYGFVFFSIGVRLDPPQMSVAVLIAFVIVVLFKWLFSGLLKRRGQGKNNAER
jgi:hypothetical protein